MRSDSAWSKLTPEQREQLDKWLFVFNTGYRGTLALVEQEFGLKSSLGSMASYHRRRQAEREAMGIRTERDEWGGLTEVKLTKEQLEQETMHAVALAAHKLARAKPEQLKVKDLRGLVKLLLEERKLAQGREATVRKVTLAEIMHLAKLNKERSKARSMEAWKKMFVEVTDILESIRPGTSGNIEKAASEQVEESKVRAGMKPEKRKTRLVRSLVRPRTKEGQAEIKGASADKEVEPGKVAEAGTNNGESAEADGIEAGGA
jgi:hypothetical protein